MFVQALHADFRLGGHFLHGGLVERLAAEDPGRGLQEEGPPLLPFHFPTCDHAGTSNPKIEYGF